MEPDAINSAFMFGGSLILWLNVYRLYTDKKVRGVSLIPAFFFCSWAAWNLYWFSYLEQPLSWWGSVAMTVPNVIWTALAVLYTLRERKFQ